MNLEIGLNISEHVMFYLASLVCALKMKVKRFLS